MSDRLPVVNSISGRMALRAPQRESLHLLSRVEEMLQLEKGQDLVAALQIIRSEFAHVEDFERDFPSLCFALATGVGKTRLMGAFITYLYRTREFRHFFVLAPNLTIYEKLIQDFTPGTPKYVFQGVSEFAVSPPVVVTGEDYFEGKGVRGSSLFQETELVINVFNIAKINSEVRGGRSPRIRKLSEYIGQSYFEYLASLPDLVLLMDEAHRYRGTAGIKALSELAPVLGLELTATPKKDNVAFRNVIYSYPLGEAMSDGFVKVPVVGTRQNFRATDFPTDADMDRVKLEDGIRFHEYTKAELELYALQNGRPKVKPFMLVVARTTEHANEIEAFIKRPEFFNGTYADKVITVHSNQSGEIKDENLQRLLKVEDPGEPTEIVIHVNKLGEGWDVTNLYTIVPLRAAASEILTEQTIGRGLRLPYGQRTGVDSIDRLTIVAHDRFQAVIDEANKPGSLIRGGIKIGVDVPEQKVETKQVQPTYAVILGLDDSTAPKQTSLVLSTEREKLIGRLALEATTELPKLSGSRELNRPEVQKLLVDRVLAKVRPQATLEDQFEESEVEQVVRKTIEAITTNLIDIPKIVITPEDNQVAELAPFKLDLSAVRYPVPAEDLIIHNLHTNEQKRVTTAAYTPHEKTHADYLVRYLIDFPEIDYAAHAETLYELSNQVVNHLASYLSDQDAVEKVLIVHSRAIADLVYGQLKSHFHPPATRFRVTVSQGFTALKVNAFDIPAEQKVLLFTTEIPNKEDVPKQIYGGFEHCLYPYQRFGSHPELRLARILERTEGVKWFKPAPRQFPIYYRGGHQYEPDFVVETPDAKLIIEPKRADQLTDETVVAKAEAAVRWCAAASEHELANGGKAWAYVLVPHDEISDAVSLDNLADRFTHSLKSPGL